MAYGLWYFNSGQYKLVDSDVKLGFNVPSVEFNLVFLMEHMYHHVLFEGIGLRQFMDYFFVISCKQVNNTTRHQAKSVIASLGMRKFAAGVMDIMRNVFGMSESELLCEPDLEIGALLLSEIMAGGNFGHYDKRYEKADGLFAHGWVNLRKRLHLLYLAPWEIACSPVWSLWQITWRKRQGY